jgi:hypothetical protein
MRKENQPIHTENENQGAKVKGEVQAGRNQAEHRICHGGMACIGTGRSEKEKEILQAHSPPQALSAQRTHSEEAAPGNPASTGADGTRGQGGEVRALTRDGDRYLWPSQSPTPAWEGG